jgi:thymidylate synthase
MHFDLQEEFPIVKAKFTGFKTMAKELLWFLNGETNIKTLVDQNCHIWDEWADADGELGPVYGYQWRSWEKYTVKSAGDIIEHEDGSKTFIDAKVSLEHVDQVAKLIETLKNSPDSRRMIITAWNVADLDSMALEPCHAFAQFYTRLATVDERIKFMNETMGLSLSMLGYELTGAQRESVEYMHQLLTHIGVPVRCLSSKLYQRSADWFLGVPFNIASYALLTHMVAQVVNMIPKEFIHSFGDAHIYSNHMEVVEEMITRSPIDEKAKLVLNKNVTSIEDFKLEDIVLQNYVYHPALKAPVAV